MGATVIKNGHFKLNVEYWNKNALCSNNLKDLSNITYDRRIERSYCKYSISVPTSFEDNEEEQRSCE